MSRFALRVVACLLAAAAVATATPGSPDAVFLARGPACSCPVWTRPLGWFERNSPVSPRAGRLVPDVPARRHHGRRRAPSTDRMPDGALAPPSPPALASSRVPGQPHRCEQSVRGFRAACLGCLPRAPTPRRAGHRPPEQQERRDVGRCAPFHDHQVRDARQAHLLPRVLLPFPWRPHFERKRGAHTHID